MGCGDMGSCGRAEGYHAPIVRGWRMEETWGWKVDEGCVVGSLPAFSPICPPASHPPSDLQGGADTRPISPELPFSIGPLLWQ